LIELQLPPKQFSYGFTCGTNSVEELKQFFGPFGKTVFAGSPKVQNVHNTFFFFFFYLSFSLLFLPLFSPLFLSATDRTPPPFFFFIFSFFLYFLPFLFSLILSHHRGRSTQRRPAPRPSATG
jgi:hypothetical protein